MLQYNIFFIQREAQVASMAAVLDSAGAVMDLIKRRADRETDLTD